MLRSRIALFFTTYAPGADPCTERWHSGVGLKRFHGGPRGTVRVFRGWITGLLCLCALTGACLPKASSAQSPTQPSKEYIYLGNRLLVTEEPVSNTTPVPPPDGLKHWWTGDSSANDLIETARANGTFTNGATIAPGKVGSAFSFDGIDDYVDLPTMNIGNIYSLEFWVYRTRSGVYEDLAANYSTSPNFGELYLGGTNITYYQSGHSVSTPNGSVPANVWSHIALTYDGAVERLYVNGVLQATSTQHTMSFNNPLRLGNRIPVCSQCSFKGLLDEISLYDRVLTSDEILAIFNAGGSGKFKYQFSITTGSLPTMFVGSTASYQIPTAYGTPPITFSNPGGDLPQGLGLSTEGLVSGIPVAAGTSTVHIQAVDRNGATANATLSATILTALIPPSGMIDWWPGDIDARDIVGGNPGTFVNGATTSSAGKVSASFSFDGRDDYVDLPTMNIGNIYSVEFWVYRTRSGVYEDLVANFPTTTSFGELYLGGTHITYYQSGHSVATPDGSVPANAWSHIALTYDGAVDRLYVNGVLEGTDAPHTMIFNNALRLGNRIPVCSQCYFIGLMDEVSLYNRALTADEILAIYNAGSGGKVKQQFNITTTHLPPLFVGRPTSYQVETLFGSVPLAFTLTSGSLPDGMSLSPAGVVSGSPAVAGTFNFELQAIDADSNVATRTVTAIVVTALTPPSGLVDWWPGDGNANDIVGTSHGTFQNGASYSSSGEVGSAFSFDGTDDYVQIPPMNIGGPFSLEFWIYPTRNGSNQYLVSNSTSGSNYGKLAFHYNYVSYCPAGTSCISSPANSVPLNTWSHVGLTYDGSLARLYVNGNLEATSNPHTVTFNNALKLGSDGSYYFQGLLDEISLYNRALTGDEILAVYIAGSNGKGKP